MNKFAFRLAAVGVASLGLVLAGCPGDDDDPAPSGAGGTAGQQDAGADAEAKGVDFTVDMDLVDHGAAGEGDMFYSAGVTFDTVTGCKYVRATRAFTVSLGGGTKNNVKFIITGFTGKGTYETGANLEQTSVVFDVFFTSLTEGMDDGGIAVASHDEAYGRQFPCTFTVTDTDLADVEIPGAAAVNGSITMQVACPELGGALIGKVESTLTPDTFEFTVDSCDAFAN